MLELAVKVKNPKSTEVWCNGADSDCNRYAARIS